MHQFQAVSWKKYDLRLKIQTPKELHLDRYGIYNLGFEVSGGGYADFDLVTLFPSDCIDGMYNPETIRYFKEYGPTMVRWPGGNFTSGYHWYDGIGKFEERKSLPNLAWGGLCTNHMGIDEFMRFCELTGVTPVIGVGYDEDNISPKEIADWVEYCNGDISTPMGAVRAKNGHPKPYDIKYWGIGNEVYGSYQIGYQPDPELYAKGLIKIVEAIRQVDPDVKIIASAYGAHNHYRNPSSRWTETVVQTAGDHIDYLDVHSYVYGPTLKQVKRAKPNAIIKAFESANLCLDEYIDEIRNILQSTGKSHIRLAFLEWGVLPKVYRSHCIYLPCRQSFVNLLCSSIYLNEFIRNGDFVKMSAHHNFSFYVQPVAVHGECVNPRTVLYKHYTKMAGGKLLDLKVSNMPVYNVTTKWLNIGKHENVPEVDVLAVRKGKTAYIVMINKNMSQDYALQLDMKGKRLKTVTRETYTHETPFEALVWKTRSRVPDPTIDSEVMKHKKGQVNMVLPPLSYTIMTINL